MYPSLLILHTQIVILFILAVPIACIAWTVTHEEVFREPREYCQNMCKTAQHLFVRKFFYLFTCEYCFSHYVTVVALLFTGYKLLLDDWRGYIIAGFSLVWIANIYMSLYAFVRTSLKLENIEAKLDEVKLKENKKK
jgi:hypothetical protein